MKLTVFYNFKNYFISTKLFIFYFFSFEISINTISINTISINTISINNISINKLGYFTTHESIRYPFSNWNDSFTE